MTASGRSGAVRPPLVRHREGRLLGGVASGVAEHLGVAPAAVRVVFSLLAVNGIGVLAYLGLWLLVPAESSGTVIGLRGMSLSAALHDLARPHGGVPHRRLKLAGYALFGTAAGTLLSLLGVNLGGHSIAPLSIAGAGALLIWWRAPDAQRRQWADGARRYGGRLGRRGPLLVVVAGVGLVVAGVASFLAANDALAQARDGALAITATMIGVLLVTGPWLLRLFRELTEERRARIREQERVEVAAHVHDSVLQTLALIQARAGDADAVRRLVRRQERELRSWLYDPQPAAGTPTLAQALRAMAADVEETHGIVVEVVVVGDAELDDRMQATVAAAREATVNAAKASGAASVSVFAEVTDTSVEVFVRDRGSGFDIDRVPEDRRGIRDSIVGRMQRQGGRATLRSGPEGTEVALRLGRAVP